MTCRTAATMIMLAWGCLFTMASATLVAAEVEQPQTPALKPDAKPEPAANAPATPPAAASDVTAKPEYRLAYRFKSGESVFYEVTNEMEITTRYNGDTEVARNKSESRKHFLVAAVAADGSADLELYIDWVRMNARFNDEDAGDFDSSRPGPPPAQFQHIASTIGRRQAKMKFSPTGKMIGAEQGPSEPVAVSAPPSKRGADSNQTFLVIFPEKPISVGESWKEEFECRVTVDDNLTQNVSMMRTYRLESVENQQATISMKTAILSPIRSPRISAQLAQRETNGTIVFDLERGAIVSRTFKVDRSIIEPFGPKTAMHAASLHVERLVAPK